MPRYSSFAEFYPLYLSEHANRTTRRLHFVGSSLALICLLALVLTGDVWWLLGAALAGYGFAWIGHAMIEKCPAHRPAGQNPR